VVSHDDSAPLFGAMADFADELTKSKLDDATHREEVTRIIQSVKLPAKEEELRRAVIGGIASYAQPIIQATNRWTALVGALALTGTLAVGFGLGYAVRWRTAPAPPPTVAGLTANTHKCEDREDGSRLCWIPVWERLSPRQETEATQPVPQQPAPQQGQALPIKPKGKG
jgi:hypothetical protein